MIARNDPEPDPRPESGIVERRAAKIEQLAIMKRWPIPDIAREGIVQNQIDIATGAESPRDKVGAARVLVEMDKQNQADNPSRHLHIHADLETLTDAELERIAKPANGSGGNPKA